MQSKLVIPAAVLATLLFAPMPARADGFLSPYVGFNFGGDLTETKLNYGVGLGFMSGGVVGLEFDIAYSPEFFEPNDGDIDLVDSSNLTTVMVNLIVGAPIGGQGRGVRPYGSGGVGLIRSSITSVGDLFDISSNDFGMNIGGGVMAHFTDHVGIRGDVRYFRNLTDLEGGGFGFDLGDFDFWRGTIGVSFRY